MRFENVTHHIIVIIIIIITVSMLVVVQVGVVVLLLLLQFSHTQPTRSVQTDAYYLITTSYQYVVFGSHESQSQAFASRAHCIERYQVCITI